MNTHKILLKESRSDKRTNFFSVHEKKEKEILEYYKTLPSLEKKLKKFKKNKKTPESELKSLEKEIEDIKSQKLLNEYHLKLATYLDKYVHADKNKKVKKIKKGMNNYVTSEGIIDKNEILERFQCSITGSVYVDYKAPNLKEILTCPDCEGKMFVNNTKGSAICEECGFSKRYQDDTQLNTWSDEVGPVNQFAYKRINHFGDWLARLQAKESTIVPREVIDQLLLELKKARITDTSQITNSLIKSLLKKLRLNKYYDNVTNIITTICGKKAPKMTKELEEKLKVMFNKIQRPFEKHKLPGRTNFLSYSFVLHKMCQLIGEKDPSVLEFLKWFPLLKSREKLFLQDKVWKNICLELKWTYYPSI